MKMTDYVVVVCLKSKKKESTTDLKSLYFNILVDGLV